MIPHQKGGKGKKGKKKGDDGEDGVLLTPEEREARAKLRIEALERELVQRQDTVNRALQAHNDVRQRQSELLKDFEVNTPPCSCAFSVPALLLSLALATCISQRVGN